MNTRDATLKKIDEVAKRTGIEASKFQKVLRCFPEPTRIEQLYRTYQNCSGSNEAIKAAEELDELLLEELEKATTIEWIIKEIEYKCPFNGKAERATEAKLDKLRLEKIEKATTREEVTAVLETYVCSYYNKEAAALKLISLCVNINQLIGIPYTFDSKEEKAIFAKRDELLLKELEKAKTIEIEEVIKIYKDSSDYEGYNKAYTASKAEWHRLAWEKAEKATTLEEADEAFSLSPVNSEAERLAFNKRKIFSLKIAENAKTIEELIAACQISPEDSEAEELALTKTYKFLSEQF